MSRRVVWFSAGGPSAVAAKLTLAEYGPDVVVAYIDPGSEHPDNERFLTDCEAWFDHPVVRLKSDRYTDTWEVWEKRRFLVGPTGALCSAELKKMVRFKFQLPDDIQVFGYTADEKDRVDRFREQNPGIEIVTPLLDRSLHRADCLALLDRAGIVLPAMYRLGYHNANCIGCPKAGMGYWNKIRVDFPDTFLRMALLERDIGFSIQKDDAGSVWLDELDRDRGDYPSEVSTECSLLCAITEPDLDLVARRVGVNPT